MSEMTILGTGSAFMDSVSDIVYDDSFAVAAAIKEANIGIDIYLNL